MELDVKLDLIIELLKEINQKLDGQFPVNKLNKINSSKILKPTEEQIRNKRLVELATKSDRKSFLNAWKRDLSVVIELQKHDPNFYPEFEPQTLKWFTKFKNPNSMFYQQLKLETLAFCKGVTLEMRQIIDNYREVHPEIL